VTGINYYYNHFTTYVNQTIMLYALKLYSDACQLFLNKTEQNKTVYHFYSPKEHCDEHNLLVAG